jgi:hypothetical protein
VTAMDLETNRSTQSLNQIALRAQSANPRVRIGSVAYRGMGGRGAVSPSADSGGALKRSNKIFLSFFMFLGLFGIIFIIIIIINYIYLYLYYIFIFISIFIYFNFYIYYFKLTALNLRIAIFDRFWE